VSSVRYEPGYYNPEDGILHNRRHEDLKSYLDITCLVTIQRGRFHGELL
jgi:hypothetical protein